MSKIDKKKSKKQRGQTSTDLKAWWMQEMIATDSPLTERLTLFWHNHFATQIKKVKEPTLMSQQNNTLRYHAMGNFRDLVHSIAKDPAMIKYLDNATNVKGKPNENFARELMELFTLGEGNYTEEDIKESARAFTGWRSNKTDGSYFFDKRKHDFGEKTFMGSTGHYNGENIIDIILDQEQVSEFITEKFWLEFISYTPDQEEVKRIAKAFRDSNYEIRALLKEILLSPHFRSLENRGRMFKSPIEFIVGLFRTLNLPINNPRALAAYSKQLEQEPFNPPNVKGWPGGKQWITTATLQLRTQIIQHATKALLQTDASINYDQMTSEEDDGDDPMENMEDKDILEQIQEFKKQKKEVKKEKKGDRRQSKKESRKNIRKALSNCLNKQFGIDETMTDKDILAQLCKVLLSANLALPPEHNNMKNTDILQHVITDPAFQLK